LNITRYYTLFFLIFVFLGTNVAQDKEKVGLSQIYSQQGGFYNFGEKDKVNIEVGIWGYVKYPGKFIVPLGSTLVDLISYAGGPVVDAKLENIRLFRSKNDTLNITKDEVIKFDYNDIFWSEKVSQSSNRNIVLKPGDIIIFPGEPRMFFKDNFTIVMSAASVLISLAILVVSITTRNN
jgi:hypothetical protein